MYEGGPGLEAGGYEPLRYSREAADEIRDAIGREPVGEVEPRVFCRNDELGLLGDESRRAEGVGTVPDHKRAPDGATGMQELKRRRGFVRRWHDRLSKPCEPLERAP